MLITGVRGILFKKAPLPLYHYYFRPPCVTEHINQGGIAMSFRQVEKYIYKLVNYALVLQGIALLVSITLAVFFRYVVGHALSWPEEVAGIFFVWFTLFGVAAVLREDGHIEFDFIVKHTPPLVGKIIKLFCMLVILFYAFLLIYHGYSYARMFSFESTPAARINLLWLTLSLPISGLLITIFSLLKIAEIFRPAGRSAS
jgi:TRAP-type C4-dicarboxylate transport system permease small subunit